MKDRITKKSAREGVLKQGVGFQNPRSPPLREGREEKKGGTLGPGRGGSGHPSKRARGRDSWLEGAALFSLFPQPRDRLRPKLGARKAGRRQGGTGGAPGAAAFPASVPLPPAAVPPTRLSLPLTSRPGRRDPGRRGLGEEAPRPGEGGGRARSPSPELQNSPVAARRAPARPSVQPPAPGEWGSPSPRGARRARGPRRETASSVRPGERAASPRTHGGRSLPLRGGREEPRPIRTENPPVLRQTTRARTSPHHCAEFAPDPEFHLPTPGLLPAPFAPRRAGKVWGGVRAAPLAPASRAPRALGVQGSPASREGPGHLDAGSPASRSGRDRRVPSSAPSAAPLRPPAMRSNFLRSGTLEESGGDAGMTDSRSPLWLGLGGV